ncbi:MAG: tRNA pseudouridine(55) synthase TruB [Methylococcales bacterium]|jgi:tRNA pseudouridine55 synthase|nr:tRNA pseudouridine(55) synthase TruB [Methylococcales bacterium]
MGRRRKSGLNVHGLILLDKASGGSSNGALQDVRRLFNANKAGHTGSLDPLATGVLPLCFGEATKVCSFLLNTDKRYQATLLLGVTTDSGDTEGKVISTSPVPNLSGEEIEQCLSSFKGNISQIPPMYSALKHQGKRLYELAREGQVVDRKAREVAIHQLDLLSFTMEKIVLDVRCTKGTYIRSLAEDIGRKLGCGATISQLRRTAVGYFSIDQCLTLEQFVSLKQRNELEHSLIPVDKVLLDWPEIKLDDGQYKAIQNGRPVVYQESNSQGLVRMYFEELFVGIGQLIPAGQLIPKRLFNFN